MKKVIKLTESDLNRLIQLAINESNLLTESDSAVIGVKNMPSDAAKAGEIAKRNGNKFTKVNIRSAIAGKADLYRDLDDWTPSATMGGSSVVGKGNVFGYAYKVNGKNNTLFGYKDWGTLNKDFVLVFVPDQNFTRGLFQTSNTSDFVGWNYVWTSQIAIA